MAAIFTKLPLSSSVNGQQILLSATTSGSAVQIHTAISGSSALDEIYLYAYNEATSSILTSILWGWSGTGPESASVNRMVIPSQSGRTLIVDGKLLNNSLVVYAYASASNFVSLDGFVNRITQ